jgi:predicted nucleic acid-binding protein
MTYLIDSDWVAAWLKGRDEARSLLSSLGRGNLAISLITFGEIYEGVYFGRDPQRHERIFRQFLRGVPVLPLNRQIMQRFARVRGELRSDGKLIGDSDILIAATALQHDRILVTQNIHHFERIPNLKLYLPPATV